MSSWSVPEVTTRTGASHARRGVVCQDASGRHSLKDRSGQPVQLMVVADGHGGKRYIHSDVGSRLACELSLNLVAQQLGQWSSVGRGATERWQEWLEVGFPKVLHQSWLTAVETHWRQECTQTDAGEDSFSPLAYGTTIALVVMTPTWWAHTGLGDWDLVRIGSGGEAELVNEEQEGDQTGGEATYSLCLTNAPRHFAARTSVHPITEQHPAFSLVLSTDGVRKSCSTDNDFFAIARYLCEAEQPRQGNAAAQLNADLDRISSQGSGDDVSVAIGRWVRLREKPHRPGGARRRHQQLQRSQPLIVQPSSEAAASGKSTAMPVVNNLPDHDGAETRGSAIAGDQGLEQKTSVHVRWCVLGILLSTACLGAVAVMAWLGLGPFSRGASGSADASPELVSVLRKEADDLCNRSRESTPVKKLFDPADRPRLDEFITSSLDQRRRIFQALAKGQISPEQLLVSPSKDARSALIAWSYRHPSLEPISISTSTATGVLNRVTGMLPSWMRPGGSPPPQRPEVVFCPELRSALGKQWKLAQEQAVDVRVHGPVEGPVPPIKASEGPMEAFPASPGDIKTPTSQSDSIR